MARRGHAGRAGAAAVVALAAAGCASDAVGPTVDAPAPVAPSRADLAAAHNGRITRLRRFESRGTVQLDWTDRDGDRHEDQGDLDLWVRLPFHVSMRVSKLGEEILWLGSDTHRYWLFDLGGDERTLTVGRHAEADAATDLPVPIAPLALVDLIGLTPIAEQGASDVEWDDARDAWVVASPGLGGPMRLYLDRGTLLPVRVESLGPDGRVCLAAEHYARRYRPVEVEGMSVLDWPQLPTLVDLTEPGGTDTIKLALQDPTTRVNDERMRRVFDLARLRRALRPDRVDGVTEQARR
ncbi:MAG: hypothetical protein ACYTG1_01205 [Planctomycetota bacterium]